ISLISRHPPGSIQHPSHHALRSKIMNFAMSVSFTIGRNHRPSHPTNANKPLSDEQWALFISDTKKVMSTFFTTKTGWFEIKYGKGEWEGVTEESATITFTDTISNLGPELGTLGALAVHRAFQERVANLAHTYHQD